MFSRLIVVTDLSDASYAVIEKTADLKKLGAKKCLLLMCMGKGLASSLYYSTDAKRIEEGMNEQKKILEDYGYDVEKRVLPGLAKQEINEIIKKEDFSLVVAGSREHSLVGKKLLESITYSILHNVRHPVLLVRLREAGEEKDKDKFLKPLPEHLFDHVLFATDFSENSDRAFTYIEKIASSGIKELSLFHVQDKAIVDPHLKARLQEFNEIDRDRLEDMKKTLSEKTDTEINIELGYGLPFREIKKYVDENDVTLTIMGSQGRGFIEEILLGSTSHKVARHVNSSVLLIPFYRE